MDFWVFRPAVDTWKHCEPLYKAYYQSIVSQKARENLLEMLCVCVSVCDEWSVPNRSGWICLDNVG